ncbi:DUF21 domain-containing protein [[Clostridium] innocuum]|nr:DUF21 domain-containing protein [[Clostridium] innocuum]MCR0385397.1 DUF21 domain-containing protein [[Clostridium] innocuum]
MDGSQICLLIVLLILVAFSALFSSTETAYSSVNMIRLKQMAKNGDKRARTAYSISKNFTAAITTILIGNNVVIFWQPPLRQSCLHRCLGVPVWQLPQES